MVLSKNAFGVSKSILGSAASKKLVGPRSL